MNKDFYHDSDYIKKQSIKKMDDKNSMWKGGHSYGYNKKFYIPLSQLLKQQCCLCGTTKKLITHHIDGNYEHNELSNITIVCRGCHNKIHHSLKQKKKSKKKPTLLNIAIDDFQKKLSVK